MRTAYRIRSQGVGNVWDPGGHPRGGTITTWQCCYHSDILNNLTQEDRRKLQEANVQLTSDLHNKTEQIQIPYDGERYGITRVLFPSMKEEMSFTGSLDEQARKKSLDSMKLDYVDMVGAASEAVYAALRHIQDTRKAEHTILSHCTADRDHIGILVTLLPKLYGVCNESILTDYRVSATYNVLGVDWMFSADVMAVPTVCALLGSTPDMLWPLLTMLDRTGCSSYLKSISMRQDKLKELFALLQKP